MGLDMYLEARKYVSQYDFAKWTDRSGDIPVSEQFESVKALFPLALLEYTDAGATIGINVGYWRKANAIHEWFVQNVQDGEDNCGEYRVRKEQLTALRDACEEVLNDPDNAAEILPTMSGFFFGDTEYGEFYFEDVRRTRDMLDNFLDNGYADEYEFFYSSSW